MRKRLRIIRSGRRPKPKMENDLGTPELIAKRFFLSPVNQTMSTCPLDALLARGTISDEAYDAANYWGALRAIVFGSPHPGAVDLLQITHGGQSDQFDRSEAESRYREAAAAVISFSRQCFTAVENLVVYERWPQWMFETNVSRNREREKTMHGLAVLLAWKRGMRKVA